ncbi:hypothetical protein R6Q59_031077 [Mikania micrantha]
MGGLGFKSLPQQKMGMSRSDVFPVGFSPVVAHGRFSNINGTAGFSEEESHSVCTFMKLAFDLEKSECQDNFQVILLVYSYIYTVVLIKRKLLRNFNKMVNAAVIVDPSTNKVIASACDQVYSCSCPINQQNS